MSAAVISTLITVAPHATHPQPPPLLAEAFGAPVRGAAGGVAPGRVLFRVNVDDTAHPDARCNDGTPAAFFVRRHGDEALARHWHISLQGGGGCFDGPSCARRWKSRETNFGGDKMTTSLLPDNGIFAGGAFSPDAARNRLAGWNHVFIYYCSSDNWRGTRADVALAAGEDGQGAYRAHFQGANILNAVVKSLQRGNGLPVAYRDGDGAQFELPDLDEATTVLFSGTSAGSAGVAVHADRLHAALRRDNAHCAEVGPCALDFRAWLDAGYDPRFEDRDYSGTTLCAEAGLCSHEALMRQQWDDVQQGTFGALTDASCLAAHAEPKAWLCADGVHLIEHHLTAPFFLRQDQQDTLKRGNYVESGFGSADDFGRRVHEQSLQLADLDARAEEGSAAGGGAPLMAPGVFSPKCEHHESIRSNVAFFQVTVDVDGVRHSYHNVLWNWLNGLTPQRAVRPYDGPGPAADCP